MAKKHRAQSHRVRAAAPVKVPLRKRLPIKMEHLVLHASCGFMEYHIMDVLFRSYFGMDATHLLLGMLGGMLGIQLVY